MTTKEFMEAMDEIINDDPIIKEIVYCSLLIDETKEIMIPMCNEVGAKGSTSITSENLKKLDELYIKLDKEIKKLEETVVSDPNGVMKPNGTAGDDIKMYVMYQLHDMINKMKALNMRISTIKELAKLPGNVIKVTN